MSHFCCPVCQAALTENDRLLRCVNGHCFDKARSGYVNLLQSQQSKLKRHGDDKRMLQARRDFFDKGFYEAVRQCLCDTLQRDADTNGVLLDAGCGEGYYTAEITRRFPAMSVCGVDISKNAVHMSAARSKAMELAVASLFSLPLADGSCDTIVSVFAPCADAEFARVLKSGGVLIRVIPTERHLYGLKQAIYQEARLNKPEKIDVSGLTLCHRQEIQAELTLTHPEDIRHLFEMTPYFYKTGQHDQERLLSRDSLCTEIAFAILTYQKP